jgi:hypothetical protein
MTPPMTMPPGLPSSGSHTPAPVIPPPVPHHEIRRVPTVFDTKLLEKPSGFSGDRAMWRIWRLRFQAWMTTLDARMNDALIDVGKRSQRVQVPPELESAGRFIYSELLNLMSGLLLVLFGQVRVVMEVQGHILETTFEVARVRRILLSVAKMHDQGWTVHFGERSYAGKKGKEFDMIRRRGLFTLKGKLLDAKKYSSEVIEMMPVEVQKAAVVTAVSAVEEGAGEMMAQPSVSETEE